MRMACKKPVVAIEVFDAKLPLTVFRFMEFLDNAATL